MNWDAEAFRKSYEDIESDDPDLENKLMNVNEWAIDISEHLDYSDICLFYYEEISSWRYEDGFEYDGQHYRFGLKKEGV